jgi:hypothetical protein
MSVQVQLHNPILVVQMELCEARIISESGEAAAL